MSNRYSEYMKPAQGNARKLKELLAKTDNHVCADCGTPDPKWASANIGVFICLKCCGVHRSLGTDISKVMSVTLDEWLDEDIDSMIEVGGNRSANSIYEAYLPKGISKPKPDSSNEERTKFIRSKYELQEFLKPSLRMISTKSSFRSSDSGKNMDKLFGSDSFTLAESTGEFIGALKVKVIRGTNLAIRDFRSSDPYVVLILGQQKARTTVIKSNLNPIWNEELKLSVPHRFGALKLQVFDHDLFSADDIMGEAEVNLHLLITAATALGDLELIPDMQFGKWSKSRENALAKDSTISVVGGKLKQEVREHAAGGLASLLKGGDEDLSRDFRNRVYPEAQSILKKRKQRKLCSDQSIASVHGAVLALAASVLSVPYDMPSWLPDHVTLLARFISKPSPVRSTVTKAVAKFRRTHAGTWNIQKDSFSEEQLEVLADTSSSSSYFV